MFQNDVETIERLAAERAAYPKSPEAKESTMKQVWTHAATALVAALLGVVGGSRSAGEAQKPVRPADSATEAATKPLTYAEAASKSKTEGVPCVVGVQTPAPRGAWAACRIESWTPEALKSGWSNVPQVVVFAKNGATLACLPATATAEDVAKAIVSPQANPTQPGTAQPTFVVRPQIVGGDVCIGGRCTTGKCTSGR